MSKEMTVSEAGKLGGNKRKAEGADYHELGKRGGATTRARHGLEFYSRIGQQGGERLRETRGPEFFSRIGKLGGAKVRELIEKGRQLERE